jgi:drug/metabolite transporter (DMT)-like permease
VNRLSAESLSRIIPPIFVVLWSTGFVGAKYALPHAEPATFLSLRFAGVLLVMIPVVILMRVPFPERTSVAHIAVAGLLVQGGYALGVFEAVERGMSAGLAALIVGLQPVLTAGFSSLVGERLGTRQWFGLGLGLFGVALVVRDRLSFAGLSPAAVAVGVAALLSITIGMLYQKRFCPLFDLRSGSVIQFSAALLVVVPVALLGETREVEWVTPLIGALAWSILALSIGAISLLFLMIRHGAATRVTSLMYLTPAVTAIMTWILFDEELTAIMVLGMVFTALGVASLAGPGRTHSREPSLEVVEPVG